MDMPPSSMMGMDSMSMTFFTSTTTPLFSMTWTPNSAGQYGGTCIFLVVLATLFPALPAFRLNLFRFLAVVTHQRKEDAVYGYREEMKADVRPWRAQEAVHGSVGSALRCQYRKLGKQAFPERCFHAVDGSVCERS
jgi:copper transporter 1